MLVANRSHQLPVLFNLQGAIFSDVFYARVCESD
jgi:hypothetical protein